MANASRCFTGTAIVWEINKIWTVCKSGMDFYGISNVSTKKQYRFPWEKTLIGAQKLNLDVN